MVSASLEAVFKFATTITSLLYFLFVFTLCRRHLIDVNECVTSPCHPNATCEDTIGSYNCRCDLGFSGNGTTCASKSVPRLSQHSEPKSIKLVP